jgi:hypothetical protein
MLGRADVVRILMNEGVQEVTAWLIALGMNPTYLEAMDETALRRDVDNIIWNYVERLGNLESEYLASVS